MANVLRTAALAGDSKIALEILKHVHGWTAAQSIKIEIDQKISIVQALKEAETRVIEANCVEVQPMIHVKQTETQNQTS
jgi:hypothetical protein